MIKIVAPEGYKYQDKMTGRKYSEVVTSNDNNKSRFVLVADTARKEN